MRAVYESAVRACTGRKGGRAAAAACRSARAEGQNGRVGLYGTPSRKRDNVVTIFLIQAAVVFGTRHDWCPCQSDLCGRLWLVSE